MEGQENDPLCFPAKCRQSWRKFQKTRFFKMAAKRYNFCTHCIMAKSCAIMFDVFWFKSHPDPISGSRVIAISAEVHFSTFFKMAAERGVRGRNGASLFWARGWVFQFRGQIPRYPLEGSYVQPPSKIL